MLGFANRSCMSLKAPMPASPLSNQPGERIFPARKRASSRAIRPKFSRLPSPPPRSGRFAELAVMRGVLTSVSCLRRRMAMKSWSGQIRGHPWHGISTQMNSAYQPAATSTSSEKLYGRWGCPPDGHAHRPRWLPLNIDGWCSNSTEEVFCPGSSMSRCVNAGVKMHHLRPRAGRRGGLLSGELILWGWWAGFLCGGPGPLSGSRAKRRLSRAPTDSSRPYRCGAGPDHGLVRPRQQRCASSVHRRRRKPGHSIARGSPTWSGGAPVRRSGWPTACARRDSTSGLMWC